LKSNVCEKANSGMVRKTVPEPTPKEVKNLGKN
jgi:hypothetical protein